MTATREVPFLATGGEMGARTGALDWSATPVGPVPSWPAALRTAVSIMLESHHPMLVWWGTDLTVFYNDAFTALAGDKHPGGLGRGGEEMFGEIWPTIGPMLHHVLDDGAAAWVDDQLLLMDRRGFPEETYWTHSHAPIRDDLGRVLGVFTTTDDTTARVVGARRLDTLRALGDVSAVRATPDEAAVAALGALAGNPADLPFAMVCLRAATVDGLRVACSIGVPDDAPLRAAVRDHDRSVDRALRTGLPTVSTNLRQRFPAAFPARSDAPGELGPDTALALPLAAEGGAERPGVLVVGTSPYRPLDEDYRAFLDLVAGRVSVAVGDAPAYVAPQRRRETREVLEGSEAAFRLLAEHADDVIGRHELDGTWLWASPSVARVAGYQASDLVGRPLVGAAHPDDRDALAGALAGLTDDAPTTSLALRVRHARGAELFFETCNNALFHAIIPW